MPERIVCPRCRRSELSRMERVIQGTNTYLSYYCGGCEHTWTVPDTLPHALPPSPRKPPPPKRKPPHR